jgi:thiol-disulfide isomerase/thioredoxin
MTKHPSLTFTLVLTVLTLAAAVPLRAQQPAPGRRYLVKPLDVGSAVDVRARSSRSLQVRVTDEHDRPVPDLPVLFSLALAGGHGGAPAGALAGGLTQLAVTNAQGVATAAFQAGPLAGARLTLRAQVVNSDAAWQGTLKVVEPGVADAPRSDSRLTPPQDERLIGRLPQESAARQVLKTNAGREVSLAGLRGRVVVLQFFGSWCGASKAQARAVGRLAAEGDLAGVTFLGLAVKDARSSAALVRQFVAEQGVGYPVVEQVDDRLFSALVASRDVSVPQTLVYGPDGRLAAHFNGHGPHVGDAIKAAVRRAAGLK